MRIDNETRQPVGFPIYEERAVVRRGATRADDRTVIVRENATLDHFAPMPGHQGCDQTTHGQVEYHGQFMAQGGVGLDGRPLPARFLRFPIPARTLHGAFLFLDDTPGVAAAVAAAIKLEQDQQRQASVAAMARSGSILLPDGK